MKNYYGYIYKFTSPSGKIYVGQHKFNEHHLDESYWGSGKIWIKVLEKYGKDAIIREVLEYCLTCKELDEKEIYWIETLRATDPTVGYNLTKGGDGGWEYVNSNYSTDSRRVSGKRGGNKLKHLISTDEAFKDQYCKNCSEAAKKMWATPDHKMKVSNSLKIHYKTHDNPMQGKKHSDESKELMSKNHLGQLNSQYGTHWYTNGVYNIKAKECPEGYRQGRICKLPTLKLEE